MNSVQIYKEKLPSSSDGFTVCAFITGNNPAYCKYADRLIRSCEKYSMPYTVYSLQEIHKSISKNGTDDLQNTKPSVLLYTMDRFPGTNILYMDADLLFVKYPDCVKDFCANGVDFAVYNWVNDPCNEAYIPAEVDKDKPGDAVQYFRYSHHIPFTSDRDLCCSGGTQFYANSTAARSFLAKWQEMIKKFDLAWDDEILNYTYTNFFNDGQLKFIPLDKSYLRLPWWPHIDPVILHAEFPAVLIKKPRPCDGAVHMYYPEKWQKREGLLFGMDCIIDVKNKKLLKVADGKIASVRDLNVKFYLFPYDYDL